MTVHRAGNFEGCEGALRELYRIADANLNRAREGLRVLEEVARFILEDTKLTGVLKEMRHRLSSIACDSSVASALINSRDAENDVGAGSWTAKEKERGSVCDLVAANFKRVQEAARVLEEFGKLLGLPAQELKELRFELYTLEKEMWPLVKACASQKWARGEGGGEA